MTTLERIQARVKKLQAQAETLIAKQVQAAVDQIRELMLKHGLTTADIEAKAKAKGDAKTIGTAVVGRSVKASPAKGKLPAKYLNPKTGETWSGHARPPAWIKDVKDRTKFLIDDSAVATLAEKVAASSGKTPARKVQSKGAQPAKYRDPKSGATWSGRGRAPKWLASARDRSKFLIEQAPATTSDVSTTASAPKSKAARKVSAVSKKVAAKKMATAAKKPAVAKKAATKASAKTSAKTAGTAKKSSARKTVARKVSPTTPAEPSNA
ncbi:histone family protein nucleoid-structuring protein H-NS [Caballeronia arvi]|uniref:Histone family protein nucleoid-structuring protein H-NS n=1 Tax=Caballeronia arvi TaxID=1777135 RepID=A0A158JSK2_9BURK|nr:H-NS family nucleoid-associated regulatory protein [Caballeronia arvi]SAL71665.1 histone family protein nucleoid-structuring protein H-NS [Caballeronia arvi]